MAKLSLLCSLSVCFLILFHTQAYQPSQRQSKCQVQNIDALEPTRKVQSEAGETEHWDQNNEQLECAGVSVTRYTIQPRGLLLPHYNNAPQITYVTQGRGMHGAAIPGCPETYQSSQQSEQQQQQVPYEQGQGQEERSTQGDQHQKVREIRQGDILAVPVGVANWFYNDGETPLVLVTLLDTSNNENQLDDNRRNAIMAPHWNLNAHSIIYVTRGSAQVQIVGNYQQPIYDGELRQDQIIVVPQNFAVVKRAKDQGFEWIAFKTNDNAMVNPLVGRTSAIRAMPREILQNAFRISSEEARRLKYNRDEVELLAPRPQSEQRDVA
ncbi:hypothetical protein AQUCO_01700714v1 [Aquilegia coerulea]|uniref:Cupin type-1 domain-containing protein n=1 Tax=Aquilegia coerulea TaxID=218851 RepID=A0A2G5DPD5_AQUCA|nr:hypothetical protein AQUCO_01700714v1 [Aquilegia coerulea]